MIGNASMNKWDAQTVVTGVQAKFAGTLQQTVIDATAQGANPQAAILANYHSGLVGTACFNATRQFFDQEFKAL